MTLPPTSELKPAAIWHTQRIGAVAEAVGTDAAHGLSAAAAAERLATVGPNSLPEGKRRSPVRILAAQFTDVMVLVLIAAAIIAGILGEPEDIVAIVVIVVLNGVLGFVQEYRAERALAALKAMAAPAARVRRDGVTAVVPSVELVPGDIVLLEAGNVVPADLRLTAAAQLRVEEAALTGESQPVEKSTEALGGDAIPLGDRTNMAYKGTIATYGRGEGIVIATASSTEIGRIAGLLKDEEGVKTPLQKRLARFGRRIAGAVIALCTVIFVAGLLRGEPAVLMFMTALSLAVAAIPEALPAVVTVSLALGARRMVRQHALIRRLPAVETLGSVTYVCTDKTGTLTQNRMRVEVIDTGMGAAGSTDAEDPARAMLLDAIGLSNDAAVDRDGAVTGDPTEVALFVAAAEAGHTRAELERRLPRVAEIPFSAERARMTTLHQTSDAFIAFTKGAPERIVPHCGWQGSTDAPAPIDREAVLQRAEALASSGLRVLAVAAQRLASYPDTLEHVERDQVLLGLVGLMDPPRPEARAAIKECQTAGIRVVMITGDHRGTALAIAQRLGIIDRDGEVLTGAELALLSDEAFAARVRDIAVYARVAPEDKIRIVRALQDRGEFVAMTGDGVNDAPALRRADIGVAMGRTGSDVAREAAHMVLLDDNFATIVRAVREGRRIYDNVRKFVRYTLTSNSGEIWALFLAPFIGLPIPLLPIHILWVNLVTDGLPGLALAVERSDGAVMHRPPRAPNESIFAHGLWQHSVWVGLLMGGVTLATQAWALHTGSSHWQSMAFTVLTLSQMGHVLAIRSERESVFRLGLLSNRPLIGAVMLTFLLQMATLYVPAFTRVFKTTPLDAVELALCLALSSVVFIGVELEKWLVRRGVLFREG